MTSEEHDVVVAESSKGKEEQLEPKLLKKLEIVEDGEDEDLESKLFSLISQLLPLDNIEDPEWELKIIPLIIQIISLVRSMDFDSQPKPESKFMSLVTQTVSLFNSMDFDSLPKPLQMIITLISQEISIDTDEKSEADSKFTSLFDETLKLKPDSQDSEQSSTYSEESSTDSHETLELISLSSQEVSTDSDQNDLNFRSLVNQTLQLPSNLKLILLIRKIVSVVVVSMDSELNKLIYLRFSPVAWLSKGKFRVMEHPSWKSSEDYWSCFIGKWEKFRLRGEDVTHFHCKSCGGRYHYGYEEAPRKIKHPLHPKHYLNLVLNAGSATRNCYCCDEDLIEVFYLCWACDYAMNIACVEKPRVLYISSPKWHEHTLALFQRRDSLTCSVCALVDSNSAIYMCPPCGFVVHLRCINLPHVIRICRHPHRISFTPSFDEGDWFFCKICRKEINNNYVGYSCIKDGYSYAAHSRCATQSNVWDGEELVGKPEIEEVVIEPFVGIGDGIIRHFSHKHHHLRLDDNTSRGYDENRQCQACITPIYFGKFYSCVKCEFILHETCAKLSRKLYHPIHPHQLILALAGGNDDALDLEDSGPKNKCLTCNRLITTGFFYECSKAECHFKLHARCGTISEPLVHGSHAHSLFLTSKPGERRLCNVCLCLKEDDPCTNETFNCIECDDVALCFKCAAIPQKVMYKHDKHILTLSYEEETCWCEVCERKIYPSEGYYMCDEYCCVTLHIECLIGKDLYMKPGSSFLSADKQVRVQPNNRHMSRPICSYCKERCPQKIVFQCSELIFCSLICQHDFICDREFPTKVANAIARLSLLLL